MTTPNLTPDLPLRFHPIPQARIWGGDQLRELFNKPFESRTPIGESWELSGLPDGESRVRGGAFDGMTIGELLRRYPREIMGDAATASNEFPLLIKFLDAAEPLSVQVHPKPPAADQKHEAWYIVDAVPGARVYIGLKPGTTLDHVADAEGSSEFADLLVSRHARAGDCFNLPSGTVHALGGGILVAEVQTTSDTTYRLYDWDRIDATTGESRELHLETALKNIRTDTAESEIVCPRVVTRSGAEIRTCVCDNGRFRIDEMIAARGSHTFAFDGRRFRIWMVVKGAGSLTATESSQTVRAGDTLLLPAALKSLAVRADEAMTILDIVTTNS